MPARRPIDAPPTIDLLVIGGGINGAGIARDAAGSGLSVALSHQSSVELWQSVMRRTPRS